MAEAALKSGADLVNDIWGFKYDDKIAEVTARYGAACCLMHNRDSNLYDDFLKDVADDLKKSVEIAKNAVFQMIKIILDPGVGRKDLEQNLAVTNHLDMLRKIGYPLLGTSRKSMIGLTLQAACLDMRLETWLPQTVASIMRGCSFVRVHDIKENKRTIKMTEEILKR